MPDCVGGCGSCCGSCGACDKSIVLAREEVDILLQLGQIPFLPVARQADTVEPWCFDVGIEAKRCSLALQCLEKRGLISIDFHLPLKGGYSEKYAPYPIRGSFALTAKGQQALEYLEIQGTE